jgi:hypothetical protein
VDSYRARAVAPQAPLEPEPEIELTQAPPPSQRRPPSPLALALMGTGAAAAVAGAVTLLSARGLRDGVTTKTPQDEVLKVNDRIDSRNRWGAILLGTGGAALLGGTAWWLRGSF